MTDWGKLKVPELKAELKTRGLPQNGLKAALVARLEEAGDGTGAHDNAELVKEGDGNESIETNTVDNSPEAEKEAPQPPSAIDVAQNPSDDPSARDEMNKSPQNEMDTKTKPLAETDLPPSTEQTPTQDQSLDKPLPVEAQEIKDTESRKRRSLTPPVSSESSRKRQRKDTELPFTDVEGKHDDTTTTESDAQWVDRHNNVDTTIINSESKELAGPKSKEDSPTIVDVGKEVVVEHAIAQTHDSTESDSRMAVNDIEARNRVRNSRSPSTRSYRRSEDRQTRKDYDMPDAEQERSVAPSIHPATAALYIRNFQRPLNRTQLKEYVTELATAPGQSPDPEVVFDFFLDSICTHAFISFSNISAASRVRSELHDRIWPDERTRQPLWADFVPSERVGEWIDTEVSSTAARSGKKWEIVYGIDDDRNVTATLQETGAVPAQIRTQSSGTINPPPVFGRLGPSAVPGAPSGPRADMRRRDNDMSYEGQADRHNKDNDRNYSAYDRPSHEKPLGPQLNQDITYTKSSPPVSLVPVSAELAERRLDNIYSLYARDPEDDFRAKSEQHRYSFEGDTLVDRGPEIFPGVRRPPGVRRRGLPRGLLSRGNRGSRGGGARDYGRDDGGGYRGYRDDGYAGFRNDRAPRGSRDPYNSGYDRGDNRGDRYDRPYDRYKDDFGHGRSYNGGYHRDEPHWRGGSVAMGRRY